MSDYPKHVAKVDGMTFPEHVHREYPKWVRKGDEEKLVSGPDEEREFLGEGAPSE